MQSSRNPIEAYYQRIYLLTLLKGYEKKWRIEPTDILIHERTRPISIPGF